MGPIDYMGQYPQFDLAQKFTSGLQAGAAVGELDQQQQARALALQQAAQYKADTQAAMANPTPQNFAALALKYPTQREAVKQSWDGLSAADQKAEGDTMSQVYAAQLAGRNDLAKQVIQQQVDARKNSGLDTSHYDNMLSLLDSDPVKAQGAIGFALSHISDPKTFAASFGTLQEVPGKVADAGATVAGKQADNLLKSQQITAQKAGALAKVPGLKPTQVATFLQSEAAAGRIAPDDLATLKSSIPTDSAALPGFLNSIMTSGIKPDDQQKYLAPTADAKLQADTSVQTTGMNNATSVRTTGMNNATQLKVQDAIDERKGGDVDEKQVENVSDLIASGRMAPLGAMAMRTPFGQAVMSRVAEKNPNYRAQDFGTSSKAEKDFATGKLGSSVRSFNVGLSHLDTLGQLADAMGNKDTQAINRIGNYFATQTGSDAPVKFEAAKKVVTDEIVKAIVGAGGTGHDREEAAKTVSSASSPAQLRGVINTYKDLMVGQLGGLDQQYRTTTGRDDFHKYLSPQALTLYGKHGGAVPAVAPTAAPTLPAGWSVQVH